MHSVEHGPFKTHRTRLSNIAAVSKQLLRLLEKEPLTPRLLAPPKINKRASAFDYSRSTESLVLAFLATIASEAKFLVEDPARLRDARLDPESPSKKSLKRIHIWEPAMRAWERLGKRVAYSEGGPIVTLISMLHLAVGIEPPNANAIRQAVRDYQRGGARRMSKKRSAPGVQQGPN
jgi:hypothetical protein